MIINRTWAMPNSDTFSVKPIGEFVKRYLFNSTISVDPFARNKNWATYTNDLNPKTSAQFHIDALDFLAMLKGMNVKAGLVIFDPPYSLRLDSNIGRTQWNRRRIQRLWEDTS